MKSSRFLVPSRGQTFVKSYGFLPFPKIVGKNMGKNIKYS